MLHLNIILPHYRLRVSFTRRRRGPHELSLIPDFSTFKNIRTGSKFSRFFRHVLERINLKSLLGRNIAIAMLTTGLLVPISGSTAAGVQPESAMLPVANPPLTTEVNIRYPVSEVRINQRYSYFHPGVDLGGTTGNPIYPIESGTVEITEFGRFGYGNTVIVDHGNGIKSRYAHLSRIDVRVGDPVDPRSSLGKLGSTGHSTGPHLHLEVYVNDRTVDPISFLGPAPVKKN